MLKRLCAFFQISQRWLLPATCLLCRASGQEQIDLCSACAHELPWLRQACWQCAQPLSQIHSSFTRCGACIQHPPHFDRTIALWHYRQPLDTLILELKFQQQLAVARLLGGLMAEYLQEQQISTQCALPECIIPVPLYKNRLRDRGFNQALEIARPIAKKLNIPIDFQSCWRVRNTNAQSLIPAEQRFANVKNAFEVSRFFLPVKHIALIDDVMTTGSTLNELSRVLRRHGIEQIDVWCLARAG